MFSHSLLLEVGVLTLLIIISSYDRFIILCDLTVTELGITQQSS